MKIVGKSILEILALVGFVLKKCAKSFSTKSINHKETKYAKCIVCGKEIMIPKNASLKNCKCNDCKNNYKQCAICGRLKVNGICENEFCKQHNPQHFKNHLILSLFI